MQALDESFLPLSGMTLPRYAGLATFLRLPYLPEPAGWSNVDIGLIGVPWDGGTTNRPGPRHGPRALRDASTMVRLINQATAIAPFHTARCADLGDISVNPADVNDTLQRITSFYDQVVTAGIVPMTAGGDHLTSLPVLRAVAKSGPVGMVHFDSHTDLWDSYFGGFKFTHGTPFRRAVEEGLLDPKRVVQIGIRGTAYDGSDREFARDVGIRVITIDEYFARGLDDVMAEAREIVGTGRTYVSFDIDAIDPSQAPGTGTPEVGGYTAFEAQRMIRKLDGLDIVGADLVEVSPPFDVGSMTSYLGVNLMFELLCVMASKIATSKGNPVVKSEIIQSVLPKTAG